MARWISDSDTEKIVEVILKWPLWKDFGWEEIRLEIQTPLNFSNVSAVWSRQQLQKYPNVKSAYNVKKNQIRQNKSKYQRMVDEDLPPRERDLHERIKSLEAKVSHLETENDLLHEKFALWQYNAVNHGMTEAMLEKPMTAKNKEKKKNKEHKFFKVLSTP
ncbi:hypothetical protein GMSM_05310 [Geomonas sp. Red276]